MTTRLPFVTLMLAALATQASFGQSYHERLADHLAGRAWAPRSMFERTADFSRDPVPQIRAHLERVVTELRARPTAGWEPRLQERRAVMLDRLAAYAAAGVFPSNDLAPIPTPVFIDRNRRACAVAHLMLESGASELAMRIAQEENLDYVPDIEAHGVARWLADSGLTLDECALIQPTYGGSVCGGVPGWIPGQGPIQSFELCIPAVRNSSGLPTRLHACGTPTVASNLVWFELYDLPPNATALLLNSLTASFVQAPGGSQGNLCLGAPIGRYASLAFTADPSGLGGVAIDIGRTPTPSGWTSIAAGETWYFQCWYRDGSASNFSNAIGIQFL